MPKLANRESVADLSVEFMHYDPSKPEETRKLKQVAALIKEKRVPVASKDLLRPGGVVERLEECVPFKLTITTHTRAWKYYEVRPRTGTDQPEKTKPQYCVYDQLMGAYGYTEAWVRYLCRKLSDEIEYKKVTGQQPKPKE